MNEILFNNGFARYLADFFKRYDVKIENNKQGDIMSASPRSVYDSMTEGDFLKKQGFLCPDNSKLLGEVSSLDVSLGKKKFNVYLSYYPVTWPEGRKQYGLIKRVELDVLDENGFFKFLLSPNEREHLSPIYLKLPSRHYLEKQENQENSESCRKNI
ncbi:MAG: hypothetical protein ACOCUU_01870 [Nanoarchaeota archaeon]